MDTCPDPDFKKFVREKLDKTQTCINKKISWTMMGVVAATVVGVFTVTAFLTYEAYSGEQERQCKAIDSNTAQVNELKTNVKVMEAEYIHVRNELRELKASQSIEFEKILKSLEKIKERGGRSK